jgi:hypothetical protein
MSLRSETIGPIPEETVRLARVAFPDGATAMRVRDELGTIYQDEAYADLSSPRGGRPKPRGDWRWSASCSPPKGSRIGRPPTRYAGGSTGSTRRGWS